VLSDLGKVARRRARASKALRQAAADAKVVAIGKTDNLDASGPAGAISVRVYTPVAAGGPSPAIVYFHGGGFVIGDLDTHDVLCRSLANDSGSRVIASIIGARRSSNFLPAVEDCFAALKWVEENASALSIDPTASRSVAIPPGAISPPWCVCSPRRTRIRRILRFSCCSTIAQADARIGPRGPSVRAIASMIAPSMVLCPLHPRRRRSDDPRLSPIEAKDVTGLPPAYVVTAGFDPLREDGVAYAENSKPPA